MKLDLKLLSMRFSQQKDELPVPTDGVNPYLLENVLVPTINGKTLQLRNIDCGAFDAEDINRLAEYYDNLTDVCCKLRQLKDEIRNAPPEAQKRRMFC